MAVQDSITKARAASIWLIYLGTLSVIVGGALSAGMAHQPSRLVMWASAYLVLASGVAQVAFGVLLEKLKGASKYIWYALASFNIGGLLVIFGTALKQELKGPLLIIIGEVLLLIALALMTRSIKGVRASATKTAFYALAAVIFLSMLAGLSLSIVIELS